MCKTHRGQTGIGTLIVFVAMVLVAAIAGGVLINTSGYLDQQASTTGEETTEEVSEKLIIVAKTSTTRAKSDDIGLVDVYVELGPGSDPINMSNIIITYSDGETTKTLTPDSDDVILGDGKADDQPVMDEHEDIYNVNIDFENIRQSKGISPNRLQPGDEFEVRIQTPRGSVTGTEITVPKDLPKEGGVKL